MTRIALLTVCAITAGTAIAQDTSTPPPPPPGHGRGGPGGPEMQERMLEMMTKRLSLTPDQVTQIKAIQTEDRKQAMAMRDDASTTGPDRRAKMMAMREAEQTKVKAVLTDEQKPKYDAMIEKMKERRNHGPDEHDGPPPPPPPSTPPPSI